MRIVKDADVRKNEILDAADELFRKKGFDSTSTNDLLEKAGIARGTLYYHFKSKEDIMDALIERYHVRMIEAAKKAAGDTALPVAERFIRTILALNVRPEEGKELIDHMHKPQNALMHQKTQMAILTDVTPILSGLVEEGIRAGLFHTPYPYEATEMLITYATICFDDQMVMTDEDRIKRIHALIFNTERLLDAESGSLASYIMRIFNRRPGGDLESFTG